jgi:hypothetical protein
MFDCHSIVNFLTNIPTIKESDENDSKHKKQIQVGVSLSANYVRQ